MGADFRELKAFRKKIEKLARADAQKFCEDVAKELAARLLAKVIKRTQPGQYPAGSGKVGGTLRRGWTAATHAEAESGGTNKNAKTYADSLPITKMGNVYQIEIINPVHYAPYVEFGHRTRNHKGWVRGKFMLTISESQLRSEIPRIIENKLNKFLSDAFDS